MKRMKEYLSRFPAWTLTIITLAVIGWLTLAPKPLGDQPPQLFPGADKIVHGLMFGFLATMMLIDWQRKHQWQKVSLKQGMWCAIISSLSGITIEFMQSGMGLGRSLEIEDMIADSVGAFLMAILWVKLNK